MIKCFLFNSPHHLQTASLKRVSEPVMGALFNPVAATDDISDKERR